MHLFWQNIWNGIGNGDTTYLNFGADVVGAGLYLGVLYLLTVFVGGPRS